MHRALCRSIPNVLPRPRLAFQFFRYLTMATSTPAKTTSTPTPKKSTPRKLPSSTSFTVNDDIETLAGLYPNPAIPLDHRNTFELLCAVVLSAQSTDKKVNEVTPALFAAAPSPAAMAALPIPDIQEFIKQVGLAPSKAKFLQGLSAELVATHKGEVPSTLAELEALPGVGHKTASVVMAQAFGAHALPVDTHIHRLAQRWGLTDGRSVEQTEVDLKALIPMERWSTAHLQIIYFGREHCPAKQHVADACPICSWAGVDLTEQGGPLKPGAKAKKKLPVDGELVVGAVVAAPVPEGGVSGQTSAGVASGAGAGEEWAQKGSLTGKLSKPKQQTKRRGALTGEEAAAAGAGGATPAAAAEAGGQKRRRA